MPKVKQPLERCSYCGNYNKWAYKGTCPQCPKSTGRLPSPTQSKRRKIGKRDNIRR